MSKLEINYIKTSELIPYENNPRDNTNAIDKVAASIKEFGFKNPIIIDENNVIVAAEKGLKTAIQKSEVMTMAHNQTKKINKHHEVNYKDQFQISLKESNRIKAAMK